MKVRALLIVAVLVLGLGGCNNPTYKRSTVEHDLVNDTGLSASQADCFAVGLERSIGVDRLSARTAPSARDREKAGAALIFAIVACSGAPYDRAKIERALQVQAKLSATFAKCLAEGVEKRVGSDQLAAKGNLSGTAQTKIEDAIVLATIACAPPTRAAQIAELQRTAGLSAGQAA
ncbi:MAG: hypothetical protein JWL83_758, partial [Actinomycetia bacterium]|nr:hypothetical protein [Actinomycetes bacterium]